MLQDKSKLEASPTAKLLGSRAVIGAKRRASIEGAARIIEGDA